MTPTNPPQYSIGDLEDADMTNNPNQAVLSVDGILRALAIIFKQPNVKYWRYVPFMNGAEWQCSVDGSSWWSAADHLEELL
jgi:hypothetical protein